MLLLLAPDLSGATTWNVNPSGTGDAPTIQAAFDLAAPGDVIVLAPGTYTDSNTRTISDFGVTATTTAIAFMSPGVSIVGSGAGSTVLDGQFLHHCLVGPDIGSVEIRDITFYRGRNAGNDGLSRVGGGGVLVFRSGVLVEDCVFSFCLCPTINVDGASGLYVIQGSSATVRRCLFVDNFGGDIGGAVGVLQHAGALFENNTFVRNSAGDGGGAVEINAASVTFDNNIFAFNDAVNTAGAVLCLNGAVASGSCNVFWANTAPVDDHMSTSCSFLGTGANIVADPLFCGFSTDDFTISSISPAAPDAPGGCGLRGAYGVTCGPISVESSSWGRIKAGYR